jgi:hypothetical protein
MCKLFANGLCRNMQVAWFPIEKQNKRKEKKREEKKKIILHQ